MCTPQILVDAQHCATIAKIFRKTISSADSTSVNAFTKLIECNFPKGIKNLKNILSISAVHWQINLKGARYLAFRGIIVYSLNNGWVGSGYESDLKCVP